MPYFCRNPTGEETRKGRIHPTGLALQPQQAHARTKSTFHRGGQTYDDIVRVAHLGHNTLTRHQREQKNPNLT